MEIIIVSISQGFLGGLGNAVCLALGKNSVSISHHYPSQGTGGDLFFGFYIFAFSKCYMINIYYFCNK